MKKDKFIKLIRTEIRKALNENFESYENPEDLGSFGGDFDELEFHTDAKDAAKTDIEDEFGAGSFEDIGNNTFEKGNNEKDFAKNVAQANLNLPSDEKELDKIKTGMEDKADSEKELKGLSDKYGFESPFSLNEVKRKQVLSGIIFEEHSGDGGSTERMESLNERKRKQLLAGIISENFDQDDNLQKLAGNPKDNGVTEDPIEALGIMEVESFGIEENETEESGEGLEFRHDEE